MDEQTRIAYDALVAKQARLLSELAKNRTLIEQLASDLGEELPPLDPEINLPDQSQLPVQPTKFFGGPKQVQVKTAEFYNRSLSESVRTYLERKGEAAPFPEILEALRRGGFVMGTGEAEEARLRLNLLKGTKFVLIPENTFGLATQYGKKRPKGKKRGRPKGS